MKINIRNKILEDSTNFDASIANSIAIAPVKNFDQLNNLSIQKLVIASIFSKSSIVKYCKNLGLKGYKELIQSLFNLQAKHL